MGAYVTQSNLVPGLLTEAHLVQLTQDDSSLDAVDADVLDAAITEAEADVDGYLGARHSLPLATVPQLVKSLTARIVRYKLHTRRPGAMNEVLEKDYAAVIKLLRDISSGAVTLGSQPEADANSERVIRTSGHTRVYGRSNLDDF